MDPIAQYCQSVIDSVQRIQSEQHEAMTAVARLLADKAESGQSIFITGCSHSSLFAQEVYYRAGGFLLMNPIFLPGMTVDVRPVTQTSRYERIPGIAEAVLSESSIKQGDVLIIASVSGRNAVPVEMALWAKGRGISVVALTSLTYSQAVTSRHASGLRLFEAADFILDLLCPDGDAVLEMEGLQVKTAAISTVTGVTILHGVVSETLRLLIERGVTPPVFVSGNLDDGDAYNQALLEQYRDQIHYM
ncbi:sugar isomerase domain-containing protein [Cohnella soli]|uniref:Sugar isomerase domain-containing protein n=1 Tax=Cohnella soli TaxID=425005 RepID=A0ABW0I0B9_9BACL